MLWAKAINTSCYVINRCIIQPILKKTPFELWKNRKPNFGYFHVFGCKFFILNNNKDNVGKFDAKVDEGIFLSYSTSSKAYCVFNKRMLVVEKSIHVVFDASNVFLKRDDEDVVDLDKGGEKPTTSEVKEVSQPQDIDEQNLEEEEET